MRDKGAKRAANRKLHIDDGCMGGGGSLGFHKDKLDGTTESQLYNGNCPDAISSNKGFKKSDRQHIFHYCIFADRNSDGGSSPGDGESPGDFFRIYDGAIGSWRKVDKQTDYFLHELGHNLIGHYYPHASDHGRWDHNPLASHLINTDDDDGDGDSSSDDPDDEAYEHCPHEGCSMYATNLQDRDYCSDCWKSLNLVWCL